MPLFIGTITNQIYQIAPDGSLYYTCQSYQLKIYHLSKSHIGSFVCAVSPPCTSVPLPHWAMSWILSKVETLASSSLQDEAIDWLFGPSLIINLAQLGSPSVALPAKLALFVCQLFQSLYQLITYIYARRRCFNQKIYYTFKQKAWFFQCVSCHASVWDIKIWHFMPISTC